MNLQVFKPLSVWTDIVRMENHVDLLTECDYFMWWLQVWYWRTLESPLDCKKIKPVNPKGNQSWIFIGRTDAEAETPILWPPDVKNWLTEKDPYAGKDWRWEEKGTTEDEIVGWYPRLNGCQFEQALGVGDGQGSLVCGSPWHPKELDMTEWLNWTDGLEVSTTPVKVVM